MVDSFRAYEPINRLKPVATGLWVVDGPEVRMRIAAWGLPFPTRMTVMRLDDGALWIHSPTELDAWLRNSLTELGTVAHVIAPNTLHYSWLSQWSEQFPHARIYAVAALRSKPRSKVPAFTALSDASEPAWANQIDHLIVRGSVLTEAVFFHRRSRTLILADLIENFEPGRVRSRLLRFLIGLAGAADPDGKAPLDMRLSFWPRRHALRAAVDRMIAWNPERVILAHGRWYETHGVAELRRAFRWVT